jgi:hypothetical protein
MSDDKTRARERKKSQKHESSIHEDTASPLSRQSRLQWLRQAETLTPTDLAVIAANIGTGLDNPPKLAARALELWQACAATLRDWPARRLAQICTVLPQPNFPVTFEDFLELMMPDQAPAMRIKLFRLFLSEHHRAKQSGEKVDDLVEMYQSPIRESGYYLYMKRAYLFTEWFKDYQATTQSIISRIEFLPPWQQKEILPYLEEQAAITRMEGNAEAQDVWQEFMWEIVPPVPGVKDPGATQPVKGNNSTTAKA